MSNNDSLLWREGQGMGEFLKSAWLVVFNTNNLDILKVFAPSTFDQDVSSIYDGLVAYYTAQRLKESRSGDILRLEIDYGNQDIFLAKATEYQGYSKVYRATCCFLANRLIIWLKRLVSANDMKTLGPLVYAVLLKVSIKSVLFRTIVMIFLPDHQFASQAISRSKVGTATEVVFDDLFRLVAEHKLENQAKLFCVTGHPRSQGKCSWLDESSWMHDQASDDSVLMSLDQYFKATSTPLYLTFRYTITRQVSEVQSIVEKHLIADKKFPMDVDFYAENHSELILFGKKPTEKFVKAPHFKRLINALQTVTFWDYIKPDPAQHVLGRLSTPGEETSVLVCIREGITDLKGSEWSADDVSKFVWDNFSIGSDGTPLDNLMAASNFKSMTEKLLRWAEKAELAAPDIVELLIRCWKHPDVRLLVSCTKPCSPCPTPRLLSGLYDYWCSVASPATLLKSSIMPSGGDDPYIDFDRLVKAKMDVKLHLLALQTSNAECFSSASWLIAHNCFLQHLQPSKLYNENYELASSKFQACILFAKLFCQMLDNKNSRLSDNSRESILNLYLDWIFRNNNAASNYPESDGILWEAIVKETLLPSRYAKVQSLKPLFDSLSCRCSVLSAIIILWLIEGFLDDSTISVTLNLLEVFHSLLPRVMEWAHNGLSSSITDRQPTIARLLIACLRSKSFLYMIDSFNSAGNALHNISIYELEKSINQQNKFIGDILAKYWSINSLNDRNSLEHITKRARNPKLGSQDFYLLLRDQTYFVYILATTIFSEDESTLHRLFSQLPLNDLFKPMQVKKTNGNQGVSSLALLLGEISVKDLLSLCIERNIDASHIGRLFDTIYASGQYSKFQPMIELLEEFLFRRDLDKSDHCFIKIRQESLISSMRNLTSSLTSAIYPIAVSGAIESVPLLNLLSTILAWEGVLHSELLSEVNNKKLGTTYFSPPAALRDVSQKVSE